MRGCGTRPALETEALIAQLSNYISQTRRLFEFEVASMLIHLFLEFLDVGSRCCGVRRRIRSGASP